MHRHWAILLAGGSGRRMQSHVHDKVLAPVCGKTVFSYSLRGLRECQLPFGIVVVSRDATQREALQKIVEGELPEAPVLYAQGGAERQDSVRAALELLAAEAIADDSLVFIHDCARPLLKPDNLRSLAETAARFGAACLAHRITDTIKRVPGPDRPLEPVHLEDLDRRRLWAMETPQVFRFNLILEAYRAVTGSVTDDTAVAERKGHPVVLVENNWPNPKITAPADLDWIAFLLTGARSVDPETAQPDSPAS